MISKKTQKPVITAVLILAALFSANAQARQADSLPIERYALYVASNDGGSEQETLKYAVTDATRLSRTMIEIGGIKPENSVVLTDPTAQAINDSLATVAGLIKKNTGKARRTEFIFYYSGHSDDTALMLGNGTYAYSELKTAIDRIPSDVHVVMLDSCFSGNFVRAKGGSKQKPFLVDDSSVVQGHAYLSSSSGFESSLESDRIQASYFTNSLVTGLRGAADTSGDNKISLNELYYYAFNDTLSQTELSSTGAQHPSFDITLVGSGDLVLTDISAAESALFIGMNYEGKYYIRDMNGNLVSELNKIRGTEITLALPAGNYIITKISGVTTEQGTAALVKGQHLALTNDGFSPVQKTYGRARGNDNTEQEEFATFSFSLLPGVVYPAKHDNVHMSFGLLWAENANIRGFQANAFGGTINNNLEGIQASGFINILSGKMSGVQAAGFINIANGDDEIKGLQTAGFMNIASGYTTGVQSAGFYNHAKKGFWGLQSSGFINVTQAKSTGAQISGFINIANGDDEIKGLQAAGFMNIASGYTTGVQCAGFYNHASKGFWGLQSSGFINVAKSKSLGAQISGFINIADEISGVQIGIVNIANKNTGGAFGLINFIKDGIISPGMYVDSNGMLFVQYQGGTNHFYTTFLAGADMCDIPDFFEFGFGFGTRFRLSPRISLDLELLSKHVTDSFINDFDLDEEYKDGEKAFKDFGKTHIPSVRLSAQYSFFKHFSIFAACETELSFDGYNDQAFIGYGHHPLSAEIVRNSFTVYPVFELGLKF